MNPIFPENSGVTLLFEHSLSRASEIDYFEIFSCLQGNQLAWQFVVKFNLLLLFLISYCWECFKAKRRNLSMITDLSMMKANLHDIYKIKLLKIAREKLNVLR